MKFLYICQPDASQFAEPYLSYLTNDRLQTHDRRNVRRLAIQGAQEYDVIWIEWANRFASSLLSVGRLPAFTILRVHDWEIRTEIVRNINWENVDALWFINPDAMDDFNQLVNYPRERQFYLPNAVDLAEWPLCASGDRHLGIITVNVQPRKRLERAIELMELLPDDYRLTIRTSAEPHPADMLGVQKLEALIGAQPKGRITLEYRTLHANQITSHRHEVHEFWSDKSHAVSVADHEGFCYGLAEGMACGAAGACLDWDWGQPRLFYGCVCDTLPELADYIQETHPGPEWRAQIEPFAAPAMAYKLEDIVQRVMEFGGVQLENVE